jgi:hypothetical protein
MPVKEKKKLELDEDFIKGMMNFISQLTNLDVSLFYDDRIIFSGEKNEYCKAICNEVDQGICSCLFPAGFDNSIKMCKAGLWCRILHITIDENDPIYFAVGHRRINGKDELSKEKLHNTFHEYNINNRIRRIQILTLLDQVNTVDESQFYNPIFDKLTVIEDYISKEYQLFP